MQSITYLLNRHFSYEPRIKFHLILGLGLMIWIFVFLWFSEPFEIWRFKLETKLILLLVYSTLCCVSYYAALLYQNYIYKKYSKWTLIYELNFIIIAVTVSFIFMYVTYYYGVDHYNVAYSIPKYFRLIFLPALFIFLPFVIFGRYLMGRNFKIKQGLRVSEKLLLISGEGRNDNFKIFLKDLLYIKSSSNYIDLFYYENNLILSKTIRNKLLDIEKKYPELIRTHRSFMVNPLHVKTSYYKNKNLFVVLNQDIKIPVSRKMKNSLLNRLPFTTN